MSRSIFESTKSMIILTDGSNLDRKEILKLKTEWEKAGVKKVTVLYSYNLKKNEGTPFNQNEKIIPVTQKSFSFFRKIKDLNLLKILSKNFDMMLIFGDVDNKMLRIAKKIKTELRIGINNQNDLCDIILKSNLSNHQSIVTFVVDVLNKIKK